MENNEIMNYDNIEIVNDTVETSGSTGIGTGVAMAIGAGVTLAVGAGIKLVKKLVANAKAKKELHKPDRDIEVDDEDLIDVTTK